MAIAQSRITVVGRSRRVDIAVPSTTAIGEYVPQLAELCGQAESDPMLPAWSLAVAGGTAYPLEASLQDLGVIDGQVLYLRDLTQEPGDAPVVKDIEEVVADETADRRRTRLPGGPVVVAFGLAWLAAATVLIARTFDLTAGSATAAVAAVAGLILLATGWGLRQKPGAVPAPLVQLVVVAAVPCLALAGLLVGAGLGGSGYRWLGALVGANLAALMGLALAPGAALAAVEVQLAVAAVVEGLLVALDADGTQAAAVFAATAVAVLAVARRISAMLVAWGTRRPRERRSAADTTAQLVRDSSRLLAVVLAGPAVALVLALPPLALAGKPFPVGAAAVISAALLARARLSAVTSELLVATGTGLIGLFALLVGAARMGAPDVLTAGVLFGGGLLVLGLGVAMAHLITPADDLDGGAGTPRSPRKRSRAEAVGMVTGLAIAPLTLGVFGVFGHLIQAGRTLF